MAFEKSKLGVEEEEKEVTEEELKKHEERKTEPAGEFA